MAQTKVQVVDVEDIQTMADWWHEGNFPPEADVNHDDVVDIRDIMAVVAQWGQACDGVHEKQKTSTNVEILQGPLAVRNRAYGRLATTDEVNLV